jgi:F-box/WD-40 domain protein MET30
MDSVDQQGISHVWSLFSIAPSKQRELMLQGILAVCCFPQLSFISAQVRELIKIDFISALPTELSFKILSYLDTVSLCKATQVSTTWNQLAEDDVVWHRMCEQHIAKKCKKCGWGLPLLDHHRLKAEKKTIERRALGLETATEAQPTSHVRSASTGSTDCAAVPESHKRSAEHLDEPEAKRQCLPSSPVQQQQLSLRPWKDVYRDRFKVGTNWKYGRYQLKTLKGHENGVMCLQLQGNILASGSYDGTIKIWDLETGKCLRTLVGHTSGIRCLQFSKYQLFSGGMDKTIRIWNWEDGSLVRTLSGPMGDVLSLHYDEQFLVCGGKDNMVRFWNFKSSHIIVLRGHKDFVNSVRVDPASETIFSAADDNLIRLWDAKTGKILKTFEGHAAGVQQITILPPQFELDESDLLDCEHPLSESEQDREEEAQEQQLREQQEQEMLQIPGDCGAARSPVARTSRSPGPETLPNISVFPDTIENEGRPQPPTFIMTASLDNTLRLWHVPTGRCLRTFFGHVEGVWALAADNLRVVSGSQDRTVKIWDARTGKCERTYTGHVGPVTCIGLSGDRLVTGSEDCDIRVMEFGPP